MKISRKSIYGVRAMIEIAVRAEEGNHDWQQISSIAKTTAIPDKFLEQILLTLKKAGFLKSRRGVDGGYALNTAAAEITMEQLIFALDDQMLPEEEIEEGPDGSGLIFRQRILQAEMASMKVLQAATLKDLMNETRTWRLNQNQGIEFQI